MYIDVNYPHSCYYVDIYLDWVKTAEWFTIQVLAVCCVNLFQIMLCRIWKWGDSLEVQQALLHTHIFLRHLVKMKQPTSVLQLVIGKTENTQPGIRTKGIQPKRREGWWRTESWGRRKCLLVWLCVPLWPLLATVRLPPTRYHSPYTHTSHHTQLDLSHFFLPISSVLKQRKVPVIKVTPL